MQFAKSPFCGQCINKLQHDIAKWSKKISLLSLIFFLSVFCLYSQRYNAYLEFFSTQNILLQLNTDSNKVQTSFKPVTINFDLINYDTVFYLTTRDRRFAEKLKSTWIYRKLRNENFVDYKSGKFSIIVNPILSLEHTKCKDYEETFFMNTRGIEIKGNIGERVYYYTAFYENQARFIPHITNFVEESLVAPGQGAVKILESKKYDFSRASAYLNIDISKNMILQFGHAKHFVGEGYRSLLLSDNSFNYPFLRFSASYKDFTYTLLWSQYQSFKTAYYNYHHRKYSSIAYLSWMPKAGFEFSLFESVMWPGNTSEKSRKFNLNYFNPIILSRSAIYGLNNEKNILLGINARLKLYKFAQFFVQFALDNIDSETKVNNNYAFQIGIKHFDLLHDKLPYSKLFLHTEFNYIAPYTYTWENPSQAYTHYNQALTHPAGSGLQELVVLANFSFRDFSLKGKASFIKNNIDDKNYTNYGSNIFKPNIIDPNIISHTSNRIGQGLERDIFNANIEIAYTINPVNHLQIFAAVNMHSSTSILEFLPQKVFLSLGIKTNINNYYYDF